MNREVAFFLTDPFAMDVLLYVFALIIVGVIFAASRGRAHLSNVKKGK